MGMVRVVEVESSQREKFLEGRGGGGKGRKVRGRAESQIGEIVRWARQSE